MVGVLSAVASCSVKVPWLPTGTVRAAGTNWSGLTTFTATWAKAPVEASTA